MIHPSETIDALCESYPYEEMDAMGDLKSTIAHAGLGIVSAGVAAIGLLNWDQEGLLGYGASFLAVAGSAGTIYCLVNSAGGLYNGICLLTSREAEHDDSPLYINGGFTRHPTTYALKRSRPLIPVSDHAQIDEASIGTVLVMNGVEVERSAAKEARSSYAVPTYTLELDAMLDGGRMTMSGDSAEGTVARYDNREDPLFVVAQKTPSQLKLIYAAGAIDDVPERLELDRFY